MNYFNQDGHFNDEGISLYADAIKLNKISELPQGFKSHLESCSSCQSELIDFSSIMSEVEQDLAAHPYFNAEKEQQILESITVSQKSSTIRTLIYRLAVAAAIGALVFVGYKQLGKQEKQEIVENPVDNVNPVEDKNEIITPNSNKEEIAETPKKQDQNQIENPSENKEPEVIPPAQNNRELFAARYVPNEEFESMIGTTVRSEDFPVEAPKNGVSFKANEPFVFKWENNIKLNLTILDNEEEEVFVKEMEGTSFDFKNTLAPGIYYWKLETAEDLLHLGQFIID